MHEEKRMCFGERKGDTHKIRSTQLQGERSPGRIVMRQKLYLIQLYLSIRRRAWKIVSYMAYDPKHWTTDWEPDLPAARCHGIQFHMRSENVGRASSPAESVIIRRSCAVWSVKTIRNHSPWNFLAILTQKDYRAIYIELSRTSELGWWVDDRQDTQKHVWEIWPIASLKITLCITLSPSFELEHMFEQHNVVTSGSKRH